VNDMRSIDPKIMLVMKSIETLFYFWLVRI